MFCQNCGRKVPEGAQFCPKCGFKCGQSFEQEDQKTPVSGATEEYYEYIPDEPEMPESNINPARKKLIRILIIIIVCAVIAAAAILTTFYLKNRTERIHGSNRADTSESSVVSDEKDSSESSEISSGAPDESSLKSSEISSEKSDVNTGVTDKDSIKDSILSDKEIEIFQKADAAVNEAAAPFIDENGYIELAECSAFLDAIEACVAERKDSGEVESYSREEASIGIVFASGIRYIITAPVEGWLGSGPEDTRVMTVNTLTDTDIPLSGVAGIRNKSVNDIAKDLAGKGYSFKQDNDYREGRRVTLDFLKNLEPFKVLIWQGHGTYFSTSGSVLVTGEKAVLPSEAYDDDITEGRIVFAKIGFKTGIDPVDHFSVEARWAITGEFVKQYFPSGNDSLVYLGCCESCNDDTLAQGFFAKGTKCVLGYLHSVPMDYEAGCRTAVFRYLEDNRSVPDAVRQTLLDNQNNVFNALSENARLTAFYRDDVYSENCYLYDVKDKSNTEYDDSYTGEVKDLTGLKAGDEFTFGSYVQNYMKPGEAQPLKWRVLDVKDGKALVISKYVINDYSYNNKDGYTSWAGCDLRVRLKDEFYENAFTDPEKKIILTTTLENADNSQYGTDGGADTQDKIFILSDDEARQYFSSDKDRQATATSMAYDKGCWLHDTASGKEVCAEVDGPNKYNPEYTCDYWLRTPGADAGAAEYVSADGSIQTGGAWTFYLRDNKYDNLIKDIPGTRPAMWLDISATEGLGSPEGTAPGGDFAEAIGGAERSYVFTSGAGAWSTVLTLYADGTFKGDFHDSDMGDSRAPNGVVYHCTFSGSFTDLQKIDDHTYSMRLGNIETIDTPGEEKLENGVLYIAERPYGLDDADVLYLYTPGKDSAGLPEGLVNWVTLPRAVNTLPEKLDFYALYNEGGEQGFYSSV